MFFASKQPLASSVRRIRQNTVKAALFFNFRLFVLNLPHPSSAAFSPVFLPDGRLPAVHYHNRRQRLYSPPVFPGNKQQVVYGHGAAAINIGPRSEIGNAVAGAVNNRGLAPPDYNLGPRPAFQNLAGFQLGNPPLDVLVDIALGDQRVTASARFSVAGKGRVTQQGKDRAGN
ncbi:hypothetical protein PTH_2775 [Pelotomaculum thermopropionicum SI]|uniref:Uncharacterized protein n=1 Tax=Pelotomaculum thermopropionicum (strain DSM 13744 / JCM 10971 / SI) TaxID=370438 RepID=A5CYH4_PELTS|nr:hypothetical protein PTH_2775 [Pelotomaculum thermopropionicum SI]